MCVEHVDIVVYRRSVYVHNEIAMRRSHNAQVRWSLGGGRGRHLYSAGRPSHWALARILVSDVTGIRSCVVFIFPSLVKFQ